MAHTAEFSIEMTLDDVPLQIEVVASVTPRDEEVGIMSEGWEVEKIAILNCNTGKAALLNPFDMERVEKFVDEWLSKTAVEYPIYDED